MKKSFTDSPVKAHNHAIEKTPSFKSEGAQETPIQDLADSEKLDEGYNSSPEILDSMKRI